MYKDKECCADCKYYRCAWGSSSGMKICHFMLDTGISREDPPEKCTHKTLRKTASSERSKHGKDT